ncbi:hypothetical protein ACF073_36445 [Streptomyces sp. NPDC015171]
MTSPGRNSAIASALPPLDEAQALRETAQELFTDLVNQFGLDL